ncbi:MAG: hypothetical protein ACRC1V_06105 [Plesiomonas sp.]
MESKDPITRKLHEKVERELNETIKVFSVHRQQDNDPAEKAAADMVREADAIAHKIPIAINFTLAFCTLAYLSNGYLERLFQASAPWISVLIYLAAMVSACKAMIYFISYKTKYSMAMFNMQWRVHELKMELSLKDLQGGKDV